MKRIPNVAKRSVGNDVDKHRNIAFHTTPDSTGTMSDADPKRRILISGPGFGVLVTALLVFAVIALILDVWMPYCRQQVAVRKISRFGGYVEYDNGGFWMAGFDRVETVYLRWQFIGDDVLKHLGDLTNLKTLWLSGSQFSDAGLKHLSRLTNLSELNLRDTQVTEKDAEWLKQKLPDCYIYQ